MLIYCSRLHWRQQWICLSLDSGCLTVFSSGRYSQIRPLWCLLREIYLLLIITMRVTTMICRIKVYLVTSTTGGAEKLSSQRARGVSVGVERKEATTTLCSHCGIARSFEAQAAPPPPPAPVHRLCRAHSPLMQAQKASACAPGQRDQ